MKPDRGEGFGAFARNGENATALLARNMKQDSLAIVLVSILGDEKKCHATNTW